MGAFVDLAREHSPIAGSFLFLMMAVDVLRVGDELSSAYDTETLAIAFIALCLSFFVAGVYLLFLLVASVPKLFKK
jgi:hypothetical protein